MGGQPKNDHRRIRSLWLNLPIFVVLLIGMFWGKTKGNEELITFLISSRSPPKSPRLASLSFHKTPSV